jgi:hypothetical protein
MKHTIFITIGLLVGFMVPLAAQDTGNFNPDLKYAQVRQVDLSQNSDGSWRIAVTLRHADSGWDHYADLWQVLDDSTGELIAERPLAHPHTNEQPFTRSLTRVDIPEGVETIRIRAKCTQHGYEGRQVRIELDSAMP